MPETDLDIIKKANAEAIQAAQAASREAIWAKLSPELRRFVKTPEAVQPPNGLATGLQTLDEKLLWKGLPQGALSLFISRPGDGATSLWYETLLRLNQRGRWAAWIDGDIAISPVSLWQRGFDFSKFVSVDLNRKAQSRQPSTGSVDRIAKINMTLIELISSQVFTAIGCDLDQHRLDRHQLQKLNSLARQYQTSLVFFSSRSSPFVTEPFALILKFDANGIYIQRALHRATPQTIQRRTTYARFTEFSNQLSPNSLRDRRLGRIESINCNRKSGTASIGRDIAR
jgi:replicative DNA helicase